MSGWEHRKATARRWDRDSLYCVLIDLELETLYLIQQCYSGAGVWFAGKTLLKPQRDSKYIVNYHLQCNFPPGTPSRGAVSL